MRRVRLSQEAQERLDSPVHERCAARARTRFVTGPHNHHPTTEFELDLSLGTRGVCITIYAEDGKLARTEKCRVWCPLLNERIY